MVTLEKGFLPKVDLWQKNRTNSSSVHISGIVLAECKSKTLQQYNQVSLKVVNKIDVEGQRIRKKKKSQANLLLPDVFHCQMTDEVTSPPKLRNICFVTVPNNMRHFFQPFELTGNGHCKAYIKKSSPNGIHNKLILQFKLVEK